MDTTLGEAIRLLIGTVTVFGDEEIRRKSPKRRRELDYDDGEDKFFDGYGHSKGLHSSSVKMQRRSYEYSSERSSQSDSGSQSQSGSDSRSEINTVTDSGSDRSTSKFKRRKSTRNLISTRNRRGVVSKHYRRSLFIESDGVPSSDRSDNSDDGSLKWE